MEAMGYMIIDGIINPNIMIITQTKEVDSEMKFIEHEIQEIIIGDIVEYCKEDLEKKENNCNPEKIIRELMRDGWL